jgi:hypothetical protein
MSNLQNNDIVLIRDNASRDYIEAQMDELSYVKLVEGANLTTQPDIYFQIIQSPVSSYFYLKKATSDHFLRVDTTNGAHLDEIKVTAINPTNESTVDKSPYMFQFVQISGTGTSPVALYCLATYYNGTMILSQPNGPGGKLVMSTPLSNRGQTPELAFEVSVTGIANVPRMVVNGLPLILGNLGASGTGALDTESLNGNNVENEISSSNSLSNGAIVAITIFAVLAFCMILFIGTQLWARWGRSRTSTITASSMPVYSNYSNPALISAPPAIIAVSEPQQFVAVSQPQQFVAVSQPQQFVAVSQPQQQQFVAVSEQPVQPEQLMTEQEVILDENINTVPPYNPPEYSLNNNNNNVPDAAVSSSSTGPMSGGRSSLNNNNNNNNNNNKTNKTNTNQLQSHAHNASTSTISDVDMASQLISRLQAQEMSTRRQAQSKMTAQKYLESMYNNTTNSH